MMPAMDTRRIEGALLGAACGDALGAAVEFMESGLIRRRYGKLREMIDAGPWAAGEGTDETGMMLAATLGVLDSPSAPGPAVGRRLETWMAEAKDVPPVVRAALRRHRAHEDWSAAARGTPQAQSGEAASSGALVRMVPVAAAYADPNRRRARAAEVSAITHWDPQAEAAAVVFTEWLGGLLEGESRREAWVGALERTRADDAAATTATPGRNVPSAFWDRLAEAPDRDWEDLQPSGFAEYAAEAIEAAVWCVLRSPDAEEAIVDAVALGGAADTLGALAGAAAGAAWGADALPSRWVEALRNREQIEAAARALRTLRTGAA